MFVVFGDAEDTKKRCWSELPSSVTLVQTIDIIRLCQRGNWELRTPLLNLVFSLEKRPIFYWQVNNTNSLIVIGLINSFSVLAIIPYTLHMRVGLILFHPAFIVHSIEYYIWIWNYNNDKYSFPSSGRSAQLETKCAWRWISLCNKRRVTVPKLMNFRKSSKRPLTPPLSFSENHLANFQ